MKDTNRSLYTLSEVWATFSKAAKHFLSATYVRLTLLFSSIFLVGAIALFSISFYSLYSSLQQDDLQELSTRLLGYWARFQSGGVEALRNEIDARTVLVGERAFFVRIADAENDTQFFSIPALWQQGFDMAALESGSLSDWDEVRTLESETLPYDLEIAGIRLDSDNYLQVGLSTENRDRLLDLFRRNFTIIASAIVGMSLILGLLLAFRVLKPVRDLSDAVNAILTTGHFDNRIPEEGGFLREEGDMHDLVVYFNEMLARIERLIGGMHDALDAVAHDLRTPITRLRGTAELALKSPEGDEQALRDALADCIEESDTMLRLLNTLMDISEAQSGALSLRLEQIDASDVLRDAAELYEYVADAKSIRIDLGEADGILLNADPVRLRQVLANLLDNAIKYSPAGSSIELSAAEDEDSVVFRVRDTGRGIEEEDMPRIWHRLYRGAEARNRPGLGLGLSLVKAIVEAHGGSVEIHSQLGVGTEVRVRLPVEPPGGG
ncbi:MAG: ATP-binding protein [Spirochaetales bacterium]